MGRVKFFGALVLAALISKSVAKAEPILIQAKFLEYAAIEQHSVTVSSDPALGKTLAINLKGWTPTLYLELIPNVNFRGNSIYISVLAELTGLTAIGEFDIVVPLIRGGSTGIEYEIYLLSKGEDGILPSVTALGRY